jgi:hypothetical protein
MACTYTINGKELTEKEYFDHINSLKGLLSIKTESHEELIARTKEFAKDRFVNMDLFTPIQEQSYTNVIYSHVLDKLGVLTPNQVIKVSPDKVFENIRNEFQNGSNKFRVLGEKLSTPELLAIARANPDMVAKFPEIVDLEPAQLLTLGEQYANVADKTNFNKFKEQVLIKLSHEGLQVKGKKMTEVGEVDTITTARLQDNEDLELTETERAVNESFADGQTFMTNPRDTASTRVKLFLSSIPDTKKNIFNMRETVPSDQVFEKLMNIGSKLPVMSYDNFQKALQEESKKVPYMKSVSKKLADIYQDGNQAFVNDFLTVVNKAYAETHTHLWEKGNGEGLDSKVIKSNRASITNQVRNLWLEAQKFSAIIKSDNLGNLVINKEVVQELADGLKVARAGDINAKKEWAKGFFDKIGIEFTDKMLGDLYANAEKRYFKKHNANNFNQLFGDNSGFSRILKKYLSEPSGKTDSSYEDSNNAMKDERIFNDFAAIYEKYHPELQTPSSRNGEGKSIYAFINPSLLEDTKRKLNNGIEYFQKLANRSFSKSAEFVKQKLNNNLDYIFEMNYMDSLKSDTKNADAKVRKNMSDKEQFVDMVNKFQNQGAESGYHTALTHSDKSTAPDIHQTKYKLEKAKDMIYRNGTTISESFDLKDPIKEKLYQTAEAEIQRMTDYANNPDKLNLKNFDHAQNLFYVWPILNHTELHTGLKDIHAKIFAGKELNAADKTYIKDILAESFKSNVEDSFKRWLKHGIFEQVKNETGEVISYKFPLFDNKYLATSAVRENNGFEKAIHAIVDQKINSLHAQLSYLQAIGADPALFFKGLKGAHATAINDAVKNGNIQDAPFESKFKTVQSTWADFSKRAAMFIAPGSKGVWTWKDSKGNTVDRSIYRTVTLDTWKRDTELFKGVDVTDAQEFITVKEHIDRMMSEGRISDKNWESITQKIAAANGEYYELSAEEREVVFQPTKPVHTGVSELNGFTQVDYVKSSTMALIPAITAGQAIDGLRKMMEKNDIASANFDSAKKTGQPGVIIQAFDKEGNFIQPDILSLSKATQVLNREGLRTQQEIPEMKDEISNISQLNRNQLDGLLEVPDFHITDSTGEKRNFTGQQLKDLKENVRINLFDLAQKEVINRLGLTTESGHLKFSDNKKLLEMLKEEAIAQKYGQNDINSLKLDAAGDFAFPLYFLASGEKFEGLLNAVISSTVKLHNPGTSLVQASAVGSKFDFSSITSKQKSDIIFTNRFDETKGLQYMRNENGTIKGAQIFVSQFIKDADGNLINLKKFVTIKDGKMTLDDTKIPEKILQLIGARIPNQNHSSDLPLEIAGFLPDYMSNTVVVPDGITDQMGADFDVDKLYTYLSSLRYNTSKEGQDAIKPLQERLDALKEAERTEDTSKEYKAIKREITDLKNKHFDGVRAVEYELKAYDGTHEGLKHLDRDQLNELYKDIHWNILTHPEGFKKIARSIDLPEVKDELAELDFLNQQDIHWSPLDAEYQIQVFNDNKGGKTGVSIFASLGAFLADNQDKRLFVGKNEIDEKGNAVETRNPVFIRDKNGELMALSEISQTGSVNTEHGLRTKSDNNNIAMNESVDNAKNKNMGVFNWHPHVLNALAGFIALSTPDGKIHDITFGTRLFLQEGIKKYIDLVDTLSDSFNEQRTPNASRVATDLIRESYMGKLSDEARAKYLAAELFEPETLALSAQDLLDQLHIQVDPEFVDYQKILDQDNISEEDMELYQSKMDNYNIKQLNVLNTFTRFDEVGKEIMKAGTAAYVYTKGLGASVHNITDKMRKLESLGSSSVIGNLENLTGIIYRDAAGEIGIYPRGEIGHSLDKSLFMARDIYKQIYPLHFNSAWYENAVDTIFTMNGIDKATLGSNRFISLHKQIFSGVKSYLFSNPTLGIADNVEEERTRLLIDRGTNKSLASRAMVLSKEYSELKDNYFFQRLRTEVATIPGEASRITYSAPFSDDIDELANNKGFIGLILSGKPELIEFAKDLVKYSLVTGNQQNATSFARFIPVEYFLMDTTFTAALKSLVPNLQDNQEFIRQHIQNNPNMAHRIGEELKKALVGNRNKSDFEVPRGTAETKSMEQFKTKDELASSNSSLISKLPDFISYYDAKSKGYNLFAKTDGIDGNTYTRINTLGTRKAGVVEYAYGMSNLQSTIASNRTPGQNLDKALRNKENIYHNLAPNVREQRITDIAMGDIATQYIGMNMDSASMIANETRSNETLWGKKANTGIYAPTDKVMVTGSRDNDNSDTIDNKITNEQLAVHFKDKYIPLLDIAMRQGSEILVGNRAGIDQFTRDYLRENDYLEKKHELGFGTWSQKEIIEPGDFDFDESAMYEQFASEMAGMFGVTPQATTEQVIPDEVADNSAPISDAQSDALAGMFGMQPVDTTVNPQEVMDDFTIDADTLAGISYDSIVNEVYDPSDLDLEAFAAAPDINEAKAAATEDIITNYVKDVAGNNQMKDVLNSIKTTTDNPFYQTLAEILETSGSAPDINIIITNQINDPGKFAQGTIYVNPDLAMADNPELSKKQNLENVIMHEVVHGYTADVLQKFESDKNKLNSKELVFATALKGLFNHSVSTMLASTEHSEALQSVLSKVNQDDATLSAKEKSLYYGLTNIHEFASMLMTDNGFQQAMNNIQVEPGQNTSILDRFKSMLFKLFQSLSENIGLKRTDNKSTVTYEGINNIVGLVTSREGNVTEEEMHPDKFNPYKIVTPKGKFDVNEGQRTAIDKVAEFLNQPLGKTLEENSFLLYGAGGTGKTASIMNAVLKAKQDSQKSSRVIFAAPTHTAKGELMRAGNKEAKTFASVVGAKPKFIKGEEVYELTPYAEYLRTGIPLPEIFELNTLILDESSMLGEREKIMLEQRLKERGSQIKVLFMGDYVQIPPVGDKPDADGFAINLRKDPAKSIGLSVVERTKNKDITELGANFRRAVDFYNDSIEKGITSLKSGLVVADIVKGEQLKSSSNVRYHNDNSAFINDFIETFKQDPDNPRNAVIITYNNEKNTKVTTLTGSIRRMIYGDQALENMFIEGEPFFITSALSAKPTNGGEMIDYGSNERMIIKSIKERDKTYTVKSQYGAQKITIPVYEMIARDKDGNTVKMDALNRKFSDQLTGSNYNEAVKGYILEDGKVFKYSEYKKLQEIGLTSIYHGYILSSHKVQGGSYNHPFVAETNIKALVGVTAQNGEVIVTPKQYAQTMYTAISRASDKVYILDARSDGKPYSFVEPEFAKKSIATEESKDLLNLNKFTLLNQCA